MLNIPAPTEFSVQVGDKEGSVRGLMSLPARLEAAYVFAHGAGAGMDHVFMESVCGLMLSHNVDAASVQCEAPPIKPEDVKLAEGAVFQTLSIPQGAPKSNGESEKDWDLSGKGSPTDDEPWLSFHRCAVALRPWPSVNGFLVVERFDNQNDFFAATEKGALFGFDQAKFAGRSAGPNVASLDHGPWLDEGACVVEVHRAEEDADERDDDQHQVREAQQRPRAAATEAKERLGDDQEKQGVEHDPLAAEHVAQFIFDDFGRRLHRIFHGLMPGVPPIRGGRGVPRTVVETRHGAVCV